MSDLLAGLHTTWDMSKLVMAGLSATWGKVKHFMAGKPATRAQRVNVKAPCRPRGCKNRPSFLAGQGNQTWL